MDGFLAGGHEDLDAHTVGGGWWRHVVRGDGEDDVFGDLGSQGGVELLLQLRISEARDVAACSDFDSASPLVLMMTGLAGLRNDATAICLPLTRKYNLLV
jgi:hypothetical protein